MSLRKPPRDNFASKRLCLALCKEELDPELWGQLQPEILEKEVISKLPFSNLVKFRAVSKRWRSVVIPSVAARSGQTSDRTGLLYFRDWSQGYLLGAGDSRLLGAGNAKCSKVCNIESDQAESSKSNHYILPKLSLLTNHDKCELKSSAGGLLFFTVGAVGVVKDIVVFNPLTGHSRALGLPTCFRPAKDLFEEYCISFLGVVVHAGTGKYDLVIAGADLQSEYQIFRYNSSLSEWIDSPILPPVLIEIQMQTGGTLKLGSANMDFQSTRSVCCNGNLYWKFLGDWDYLSFYSILEFQIESGTWRIIPVDFRKECNAPDSNFHMATCKDKLLLWHAHGHPLSPHLLEFRGEAGGADDQSCFVEPNGSHPDSLLRAMPQEMIDGMEGFVKTFEEFEIADRHRDIQSWEYFAISQGDFLFHVMLSDSISLEFPTHSPFLRIVTHDMKENVYTELPMAISRNHGFWSEGLRCFSASWFSP